MSPMRLIILAVAAGAAIVAALLVRNMSAQSSDPNLNGDPLVVERVIEVSEVKVLVAAADLRIGSLITPEDLRWEDWPEKSLHIGYFTEVDTPTAIEDLVGSVVRISLYEDEPILPQKLVMKGETGFMAALIKPGMRAISVEISPETASAGFILPDDRVDVILTYEVESNDGQMISQQPVTRTIIENARVLAIDQIFGEVDGAPALTGSTATLELEPLQTELLAHAGRMGMLSLSLRSVADADQNDGTTLAYTDLLKGGGKGNNGITIYRNGTAGPGGS